MKKGYFLFLFLIYSVLFASSTEIDSIIRKISKAKNTKKKIELYLKLGDLYKSVEPDSVLPSYQKALLLTQKINTPEKKDLEISVNSSLGIYYMENGVFNKSKSFLQKALDSASKNSKIRNISDCYNNFGSYYFYQSKFDSALVNYKTSLNLLNNSKANKRKGDINKNIGNIYLYMGIGDTSLFYYQKSLNYYEETGDKTGISNTMRNIGLVYSDLAQYEKAFDYYKRSILISQDIDDQIGLAKSYGNIGNINIRQSDYEEAKDNFTKALQIFKNLKDRDGESTCYYSIAMIYKDTGIYDKAIEFFHKSLTIDEELGNPLNVSSSLNKIGNIYEYRQEYDKALEYFKKALDIRLKIGYKNGIASCFLNFGNVYIDQKSYSKAIEYFNKALKLFSEINDENGIAICYQNIGSSLLSQNKYDEALIYLQKSIKIEEQIGDKQEIANIGNQLAVIYKEQKKYTKALKTALNAIQIAKNIKTSKTETILYNTISTIYEAKGEFDKALEYFKMFKTHNDSLFNKEKSKQIIEIETKYKSEKKERDNALLLQQNRFHELTISRQKSLRNFLLIILLIILISLILFYNQYRQKKIAFNELEESDRIIRLQKNDLEIVNRTRDRFFSIISHDLKNNFTSLQMGTQLLSDIEELSKNEIVMISQEIGSSVDNLYKFLGNLLDWAKIQIGRIHHNPQKFIISEVTSDIINIAQRKASLKNIEISSSIKNNNVFADKNMIYSVIHNLVSNAIKFTNTNGKIMITQEIKDDELEIIVSDNGVGMTPDRIEKLFKVDEIQSHPGTNGEKGTGLGLVLCKEFIEKNNGKIWIESELERGTSIHITLALYKEKKIIDTKNTKK